MASGGGGGVEVLQIDEVYEFSAPKFFDFVEDEMEEDVRRAELWFENSLSYPPSPLMPKIRECRSIQIDNLREFGDAEKGEKQAAEAANPDPTSSGAEKRTRTQQEVFIMEIKDGEQQEIKDITDSIKLVPENVPSQDLTQTEQKSLPCNISAATGLDGDSNKKENTPELPALTSPNVLSLEARNPATERPSSKILAPSNAIRKVAIEACVTPKVATVGKVAVGSSKVLTATKIANSIKKQSCPKQKPKTKSPIQFSKSAKPMSIIKGHGGLAARNAILTDIAQENQAVKRQKLDDGSTRQILNLKHRVLKHKSRLGAAFGSDPIASFAKGRHEDNPLGREATPFISAAEMVQKFQTRTRDLDLTSNKSLSHDDSSSLLQRRPILKLTRPKEPELETAHRVRAVRIKSSAELEEEMLAKIPKFKARPVNKKILEARTLASLPRSAAQAPVFEEFHLKTMERANQHAETSSVISAENSDQNQRKTLKLTEPKPPHLETSLRARPLKIKSSQELEQEELEKMPKFKARPLNKKILESQGDIGLSCQPKPQLTVPQEFHFATDDRLGPPAVLELFDKLSLHSESSNHEKKEVPRMTIPNPFILQTEERGAEKEKHLIEKIMQKQLDEEKARIQKANPYPYTTDYPVVPPKPEPKQCTKPEIFQLESLVRHEEEMQRKMQEIARLERETTRKRHFKARPILKDDPLPIPERERRPLTEVQEFVLHVDNRAVDRSEFDKKIKEKEQTYKRMREEEEHAKIIEEEKAVKQMRRTMVPHAKPIPKFDNPFVPMKSAKKITTPKSPDLLVNHRGERRQQAFFIR